MIWAFLNCYPLPREQSIGKVAIVTRGNAGIGLATVQNLARAEAKGYLAARATRERILGHHGAVLGDNRYLQGQETLYFFM